MVLCADIRPEERVLFSGGPRLARRELLPFGKLMIFLSHIIFLDIVYLHVYNFVLPSSS